MPYGRTRKVANTAATSSVNEQADCSTWAGQLNAFKIVMEEIIPRTYADEIEKFNLFCSALNALESSELTGSLFNNDALARITRQEETRFDVNIEMEGSLFVCLKSYVIKTLVTFSPRVDHGRIKLIDVQGIDITLCAVRTDAVLWLNEATLERKLNGVITLNGTIINPLRTDDLLPICLAFGQENATEARPESLVCNHSSEHDRNLQAQHLRLRVDHSKSETTESLLEVLEDCLECGRKQCNDLSHWLGEQFKAKQQATATLCAPTSDETLEV